MNALVKKEVRLLLPTFAFAVATALASIFFHNGTESWFNSIGNFLGGIFLPAIVVMLALNTFGVEVGTQTFSMMLAQPVTRLRIWQTKISVLMLTLLAVGLVWYVSVMVPSQYNRLGVPSESRVLIFESVALGGMAVFTGALWTVLLLRQVAAAFWFTLIVPGALLAIVAALCSGSSDEFILAMVASVLGVYSLAGFFFARWLFFRAQDLQWTGGNIVLPEWRGLGRVRAAGGSLRMWRPNAALWRKEFQLHQSQLVIAFVLLVLHLVVLAVRGLCDLHNSPDLEAILKGFWVLWLVMPLLVGCAAVAEERKLGIHESQLCLPVRRRTQFVIKCLVALGLSIFLGGLMPILLEVGQILPNIHFSSSDDDWWRLLILPGIPALICAISFYISTMARNTLQTLAPAVLAIIVVWPIAAFVTLAPWFRVSHYVWSGPLGGYVILPVLAATLLWLTYANFQRVLTGWQLIARNLLAILSVLVLGALLTSAIYHRFWEALTPFEPSHGTPRLSLSEPANLERDRFDIPTILSARLPDGRIWTAPLVFEPKDAGSSQFKLGNFKVSITNAKDAPGTNWLVLNHSFWLTAGIKTDGTLWVSKNPPPPHMSMSHGSMIQDQSNDLVQFGSETNWKSLFPIGRTLLLIKKDGTLWRLGEEEFKGKNWPGLLAYTPHQLGSESNWDEVAECCFGICLYKTDGTAWSWIWNGVDSWNDSKIKNQTSVEVLPKFFVHAAPALDHHQMRSTAMIWHGLAFAIGVRSDGTLRIWAHERPNPASHKDYQFTWAFTDQQIGTGTNWVAVTRCSEGAVTLKNDGTLWYWDFQRRDFDMWDPLAFDGQVARIIPVQLGSHSDWISIYSDFALAADGSLWFWPLLDAGQLSGFLGLNQSGNNGSPEVPLLDISHKPQYLGNIFTAAN